MWFANMTMDNFQGKDSSDEEDLHDFPDDDQYDTEDSFIDDAELVSVIDILHIHVNLLEFKVVLFCLEYGCLKVCTAL